MAEDIWKPVYGYEDDYEVNQDGVVRSISIRRNVNGHRTYSLRKEPLILKPQETQRGYERVCLCKEGKRHTEMVHRLVAGAFIRPPRENEVINHKDFNIKNNNYHNLEWCSQLENIEKSKCHRRKHIRFKTNTGEHHISYNKCDKTYRVYYTENGIGKTTRVKDFALAIKIRDELYKGADFAS